MDEKTTRELQEVLQNASSTTQLERYLDELPDRQPHETFRDYFQSLESVRALAAADLIKRSGIERTYYYQIMNGTRRPGRDKVVALCVAAGLSVKETQRALEIEGHGALYSKNRRDAILIFCIEKKLSVTDTNELLEQFGETLLE